ncbi:sigma-54 dependent transcriptional regulator [Pirellulales bacterium]|nr:sigma-54 dependent transcriptional regulator [Pirellulales bacterium]
MPETNIDLLIVDDDDELRNGLANYFRQLGHSVDDAESAEAALERMQSREFTVAVLDMVMPGMSGVELLEKIKNDSPETEVILLTGEGTIEKAVEAMKLRAFDFLAKPVRMKQLDAVVQKAAESGKLRKENRQLRALVRHHAPTHRMIGDSRAMQEVFRLIDRSAPSDKPILIQGESGTGKELVARAIHESSSRADKPLVVVNCAALPEPLLESELFGHEKGSFTGASTAKPGLFEVADGGTLFVDEIGELSPTLQPKLLRVLEDGSLRRVGSLKERRVDVRIVAATNRDLAQEVEAKRFREDLYYRINIMTIVLPPLRARDGDRLLLADHFAGAGWEFAPACRDTIAKYAWPGNVRQLINAIERAKMLAEEEVLRNEDLPPEVLGAAVSPSQAVFDADIDLATLTRARVVQALQQENGNKLRSAKVLGVSRRSLYRLIEKYSITSGEIDGLP